MQNKHQILERACRCHRRGQRGKSAPTSAYRAKPGALAVTPVISVALGVVGDATRISALHATSTSAPNAGVRSDSKAETGIRSQRGVQLRPPIHPITGALCHQQRMRPIGKSK